MLLQPSEKGLWLWAGRGGIGEKGGGTEGKEGGRREGCGRGPTVRLLHLSRERHRQGGPRGSGEGAGPPHDPGLRL